tara:strand:- start:5965 stop:6648 length:684 start_codon:yes stop_codon:yes gene_type:complete
MELEPHETEVDAAGIKIRTFYRINDKNELVKVTQQIKVITMPKHVANRQDRLRHFGNITSNNNINTTVVDNQDVYITSPSDDNESSDLIGNMEESYRLFQEKQMIRRMEEKYLGQPDKDKSAQAKYVAPGMRNKKFDSNEIKYNYLTLRVNNISDDTKEQDLADLFSVFGNIKRVFIVTDKMTKRSKGFGFVSYFNKEDAKRGLENINGIAYDNLILQVEYSIDRDN